MPKQEYKCLRIIRRNFNPISLWRYVKACCSHAPNKCTFEDSQQPQTETYIVLLLYPFVQEPSLKRDMFCFQDRSWWRYQWRQQNRGGRGGGQGGQRWRRCRLRRSSRSANQVRVQRHENSSQGSDSVHRLRGQSWRWDPNFPFPYMHHCNFPVWTSNTTPDKKKCLKAKKLREKFCNHLFA